MTNIERSDKIDAASQWKCQAENDIERKPVLLSRASGRGAKSTEMIPGASSLDQVITLGPRVLLLILAN